MPCSKVRIILLAGIFTAAAGPSWSQDSVQDASETPFQNSDVKKPSTTLNAGANSFAQGQARALLESKGYSQVSSLVNGSDGIWRGTAVKDGNTVDVSVDFQGHVAAR